MAALGEFQREPEKAQKKYASSPEVGEYTLLLRRDMTQPDTFVGDNFFPGVLLHDGIPF